MMTANLIKTSFLILLLLYCTTSIRAQDLGLVDESYPDVQQISLQAVNQDNRFVQFDSAGLYAFVFLSPECPLCKNYSLVLNTLKEKFGNGVRFYGIVPGRTYSNEEVLQYINGYKIQFPIWIDRQKKLSSYMKATTTPEVVLLNKKGAVVYRGAIDDWVQALGKKKPKPQQRYLEEAIIRYLQKKDVLVKKTHPIGCLINEF